MLMLIVRTCIVCKAQAQNIPKEHPPTVGKPVAKPMKFLTRNMHPVNLIILIYQALAKIWLWRNLHRRLAFLYFYYLFLNKNALFHLHAQSSIWLLMCRIFTFVCNRYNEHKFQYKQRKVRRFMCGNLAFHSMCRGLLSKPQAFKISRPSLPHLNVTCSLRWAIFKIHFCLFLLVRVTVYAGSATHYHLILLILKHMLPLVTAVWATLGKKKIYIYIYTYIFLHVCLMSVDNFVTTCHDLLHSACQTALCSTLFLLTLFLQRQLCPRLRLCMFVARWKSKLDNSSSAISEACCVVREHYKEMSGWILELYWKKKKNTGTSEVSGWHLYNNEKSQHRQSST